MIISRLIRDVTGRGTTTIGVPCISANVRDYGAVPDGATDSTAGFLAAIAGCRAHHRDVEAQSGALAREPERGGQGGAHLHDRWQPRHVEAFRGH